MLNTGVDLSTGDVLFTRFRTKPRRRGGFDVSVASPEATPETRQNAWAFVIKLWRSFLAASISWDVEVVSESRGSLCNF